MTNKYSKSDEALGFGFIVVVCFLFSTCSYDMGKKHGRKEVFLKEVSCIQHLTKVHCAELPYEAIGVDLDG